MLTLTPRQMEALRAIRDLTRRRGPTIRELGRALGLLSTCTTWRHVDRLVDKGMVCKGERENRGIELTAAGMAELNPAPAPAVDGNLSVASCGEMTAVMRMQRWDGWRIDRLGDVAVNGPGIGFIPVYATEEEALRDFPDGPFARMRLCESDGAAAEDCAD